jgi:hypothetical protein
MLVNSMFLVTYVHTKAHTNLQNIGFETMSIYGLLNQADLAMKRQLTEKDQILLEIKSKISQSEPGEAVYVCNIHELL